MGPDTVPFDKLRAGRNREMVPGAILSLLIAEVPRLSADQCCQISRSVHNTKNENLVVLETIDDAIAREDNFAEIFMVEFGNNATDARIFKERFSRLNDAIDKGNGVEDGIAGDKVFNILEIVPGSQRPADLRHRAILSFSSSRVSTRPSATS
jgi:hypothetical protein